MMCFCYLCQKMFFILGLAYADPFVVQVGPQRAIFRGLTNFFFQNYSIATEVINISWIN